jgi:hypothetical protein
LGNNILRKMKENKGSIIELAVTVFQNTEHLFFIYSLLWIFRYVGASYY